MTIHHVLDTGAVYLLHDKHRPPLWGDLEKLNEAGGSIFWIPSLVLTEAGQAKALQRKKLEKKGSWAKSGVNKFNHLAPARTSRGLGSAVLAGGKGFADVTALRRGLRPPCLRLRSSHRGRPSRAARQPGGVASPKEL